MTADETDRLITEQIRLMTEYQEAWERLRQFIRTVPLEHKDTAMAALVPLLLSRWRRLGEIAHWLAPKQGSREFDRFLPQLQPGDWDRLLAARRDYRNRFCEWSRDGWRVKP
jgi:hypothetical protein